MEEKPRTYDLKAAVRAVRDRLALVVAAAVLVGAAALAWSVAQDDVYTATATVLPRDPGFEQQAFDTEVVLQGPEAQGAFTQAGLADLDDVAERASVALGGTPSRTEINDTVEITPEPEAGLLFIEADADTPEGAAELANTYAEATIDARRDTATAVIREARERATEGLEEMPADSGDAARLQRKLDQLRTFEDLQTGNLEAVEEATPPPDATSPRPVQNAVAGGLAGLLLGIGLALLLDRARPRLSTRAELERVFGAPVLATLGEGDSTAAMRILRTRLLHRSRSGGSMSVLVAPVGAEPAAEISSELASTAAGGGIATLLIDADLSRGGGAPGLAELLTESRDDKAPPVTRSGDGSGPNRLAAGGPVADPAAVLGRPALRRNLEALESEYELIILSAATLTRPDSLPMLGTVDAVVLVVAATIHEAPALELRAELEGLDVKPAGLIVVAR